MRYGREIGVLVLLVGMVLALQAQDVQYQHPHYAFSFEASPSWTQALHDYNGQVFEVVNPNNNMQIRMSFVAGCRNAKRFMKEISGRKGLICKDKPYDTILNEMDAVMMQGACLQGKEPYRRMLVGIPGNQGLYLMEISCPSECFLHHKEQVRSILSSLKAEV